MCFTRSTEEHILWIYQKTRRHLRPLRKALVEARAPALKRDRLDNSNTRLLLSFAMPRDASCVDIGAHMGSILKEIVRVAPEGNHYAFEALPHLAAGLADQFPRVNVRAAALGATSSETTFVHVVEHEYLSGLLDRTDGRRGKTEVIKLQTARLDDELPRDYQPDFIKIDVEGGELSVLEGARDVIGRSQPIVLFEFGLGASDYYGVTPSDIAAYFDSVGLRIFTIDGDGPLSLHQLERIYADHKLWVFIAHR